MALIVEDGSIVANADSYVSLADARTRATILGVNISATDGTAELQLQQSTIWIDLNYQARFQGDRVDIEQSLAFPRSPVYIDKILFASDDIPQQLIDAQIYLAAQLESGESLYSNNDGRSVKLNEVVGAVKQEYFDTGKTGAQKQFSNVVASLQPLLRTGSGKYSYGVRS